MNLISDIVEDEKKDIDSIIEGLDLSEKIRINSIEILINILTLTPSNITFKFNFANNKHYIYVRKRYLFVVRFNLKIFENRLFQKLFNCEN